MLGLDMENVRLKSHDKAHRRSAIFIQRRQERSLRLSGKKLMFSVVLSDKTVNRKHSYTQQTTVESSVQRISIRCGFDSHSKLFQGSKSIKVESVEYKAL